MILRNKRKEVGALRTQEGGELDRPGRKGIFIPGPSRRHTASFFTHASGRNHDSWVRKDEMGRLMRRSVASGQRSRILSR